MDIRGKTALITGGAKRVGKVIALTLAQKGADIAITFNHSSTEANATVDELKEFGVKAAAFQCDVTQWDSAKAAVAAVHESFGRIDILVNNAAVFFKTPFETLSEDDWDNTIGPNLKGPFMFCKFVGDIMLQQESGKIINIADWAGMRPYLNYIPYCISKAGVICLTQVLAKTLAPHVQVNAIGPGPVMLPADFTTEEVQAVERAVPLQRVGSPQDIANTVAFLIEGSDFITGSVYLVDGGRSIA